MALNRNLPLILTVLLLAGIVPYRAGTQSRQRPASAAPEVRVEGTGKAAGLARAPWPCFRGNARNTACVQTGNKAGKSWTFETPPVAKGVTGIFASPAIGKDGTVYIGADSLYALDGTTGVKKWDFYVGGMFNSCPAVSADGSLYAGCDDGNLYVLNQETGKLQRTLHIGEDTRSSPALGRNGLLYIGSSDHYLYAFHANDGKQTWKFDTRAPVASSASIDEHGQVYCVNNGNVYALEAATGSLKWTYQSYRCFSVGSPAIGADGTIYVGMTLDGPGKDKRGEVVALAWNTGKPKWRFPTGAYIFSTPAIGLNGAVYIGCGDHNVYALDAATGAKKWELPTGGFIQGSPAVGANGTVYVGSLDSTFYAIHK